MAHALMERARSFCRSGRHMSGQAAIWYQKAFSVVRAEFSVDDLIDFARCVYVSHVKVDKFALLGEMVARIAHLQEEKRNFLLFLFYAALNESGPALMYFNLDSAKQSKWNPLRLKVALDFLAENRRFSEAEILLESVGNILDSQNRKGYNSKIVELSRCKSISVLRDDPGFKIIYYRKSASFRRLVVCFDTIFSDKREGSFGITFCLNQGLDVIHVAQASMTNYQFLSFEEFANIVLPLSEKYDDVVCYGSSLGGYAALYYSGAINARVISFSPLNSLDPLLNYKLACAPYHHLPLNYVPKTGRDVFIALDIMQPKDKIYHDSYLVKSYPAANYLYLDYAGHSVTGVLVKFDQLKPSFNNIIENNVWGVDVEVINTDPYMKYLQFMHYAKGGDVKKAIGLAKNNFSKLVNVSGFHESLKDFALKYDQSLLKLLDESAEVTELA